MLINWCLQITWQALVLEVMLVSRNSCFVWKEQKMAHAGKKTAEGTTNMAPVRNVQCAALVDVKRTAIRVQRSLRKLRCYMQAPTMVEMAQQVIYVYKHNVYCEIF
jgi:hypothetical protein